MSFETKIVSARETFDLRSRILRPGQAIELCQYPEDHFATSFHLAVFHQGRVVSNGTFLQQGHDKFSNACNPYRLRGMATDWLFQRQGLGSLIIAEAMKELKMRGCDLIWFNARTSAEIFYDKLGFNSLPEIFDIALIGPHKIMYKSLSAK